METDRLNVSEIFAVGREAELVVRGMEITGVYSPVDVCENYGIKNYLLFLIGLLVSISANAYEFNAT